MQVSDSFTASLTGPKSTLLHGVQGDAARMVVARLYAGTEPWTVPAGVVGGISYELPDGTPGYYEELTDGQPACTFTGNQAAAVIAPGLCRQSGTVKAAIVLRQGERQISTFPFALRVVPRPGYPELSPDTPDAAPAFAGMLYFGDEGGNPIPLGIGEGLIVSDGQLTIPAENRPVFDSIHLASGVDQIHLVSEKNILRVTFNDGEQVLLRNLSEPLEDRDGANKAYVDSVAAELWAELRYEAIRIGSFSSSAAAVELGTVLENVKLTWSINKMPASQTLDGEALPVEDRSATISGPISESRKFTLKVTDEREAEDSLATTVLFCNGIYYGAMAEGAQIDSAAILGLTRKLQGNRGITFTVSPEGERPVYALPTRYGTPSFVIGGFTYEWEKAGTIDFTNGSGFTESYDVWRHGQAVTGSVTVTVS